MIQKQKVGCFQTILLFPKYNRVILVSFVFKLTGSDVVRGGGGGGGGEVWEGLRGLTFKKIKEKWSPATSNINLIKFSENCIVVVVLLFYVHGKRLRSCWDGQLT